MENDRCGYCGSRDLVQQQNAQGPHWGREYCGCCRRFLRWLPKPDSERSNRPAAHRELVDRYGRGFCELCLAPAERLPADQTLEAHHVIEYAEEGSPERENIWIVCTRCAKLIHWVRKWCRSCQ
jgi:hypothetical protein